MAEAHITDAIEANVGPLSPVHSRPAGARPCPRCRTLHVLLHFLSAHRRQRRCILPADPADPQSWPRCICIQLDRASRVPAQHREGGREIICGRAPSCQRDCIRCRHRVRSEAKQRAGRRKIEKIGCGAPFLRHETKAPGAPEDTRSDDGLCGAANIRRLSTVERPSGRERVSILRQVSSIRRLWTVEQLSSLGCPNRPLGYLDPHVCRACRWPRTRSWTSPWRSAHRRLKADAPADAGPERRVVG